MVHRGLVLLLTCSISQVYGLGTAEEGALVYSCSNDRSFAVSSFSDSAERFRCGLTGIVRRAGDGRASDDVH